MHKITARLFYTLPVLCLGLGTRPAAACPFEPDTFFATNGERTVVTCKMPPNGNSHLFRIRQIFERAPKQFANDDRLNLSLSIHGLDDIFPVHTAMSPSGSIALWFSSSQDDDDPNTKTLGLILVTPEGELDVTLGDKGYMTLHKNMRAESLNFVDDNNIVLFMTDSFDNAVKVFWLKKVNNSWNFHGGFGNRSFVVIPNESFIRRDIYQSDFPQPKTFVQNDLSHTVVNSDGSFTLTGTIALPAPDFWHEPSAVFVYMLNLARTGEVKLRAFQKIQPNLAGETDVVALPDSDRLTFISEAAISNMTIHSFGTDGFASRFRMDYVDRNDFEYQGSALVLDADTIALLVNHKGTTKVLSLDRNGVLKHIRGNPVSGLHCQRTLTAYFP